MVLDAVVRCLGRLVYFWASVSGLSFAFVGFKIDCAVGALCVSYCIVGFTCFGVVSVYETVVLDVVCGDFVLC